MKQKFTISAILVLVTLFAFGQRVPNEKLEKLKLEKQRKALGKNDKKIKQIHLFKGYQNFSKKGTLKSSQSVKQKLDSMVFQNWDETDSLWMDADEKEEYIYDANWKATQYIGYERSETTGQWEALWKEECSYNANGYITLGIYYSRDDSSSPWENSWKDEYIYDTNWNISKYLSFEWNGTSSRWDSVWKEEYTYNTNNRPTQYIEYDWNSVSSQWDVSGKTEYIYDINGNMTQESDYYWNETSSQWVAEYKTEYTYNANGDLTQYIEYDWNEASSKWDDPDMKEVFSYDTNYSFNDLILPFYGFNTNKFFNHKPNSFTDYEWDSGSSAWVNDYKGTFYYSSENISSINKTSEKVANISPNPVSDYITLNFSGSCNQISFELFDMRGCKLISKKVKVNEPLNLQSLSKGMYIYNIYMDGKKQSGKLIKN